MNEFEDKWIWIFQGENATSCTAVFTEKEKAELWIFKHSLSGSLTRMPVNKSVYDWAIELDFLYLKKNIKKWEVLFNGFQARIWNIHIIVMA
ncbi:MAG: hypothetical protein LBU73_04400 [Helicobacteraceae bacterium]|jgi:hypothetical protein|nr:hypothetical protein [Helicobacteraceae bacterium]